MNFGHKSIFCKIFRKKKLNIEVPSLINDSIVDISNIGNIDVHIANKEELVNENRIDEVKIKETAKLKSNLEIFEKELSIKFKRIEDKNEMYAAVSINDGETKQQLLIYITTHVISPIQIKVIPVIPSGKELFGYSNENPLHDSLMFEVKEDDDNPGEVYLDSLRMRRIISKYKNIVEWEASDIKEYVQEIIDWTSKTAARRKIVFSQKNTEPNNAKNSETNRFHYSKKGCSKCNLIIISDRAYTSILAEAISRDPLETGGILLGHFKNETWYVVEATDPGLDTFHSAHHLEMDVKYHNHIYPVISRLYQKDLWLLGLWHRHPGDLITFSNDDNLTNQEYAKSIGNGTLSFIVNFASNVQLTCYYYDQKGTQAYYLPEVKIGDKYFEGTEYLIHANESILESRKIQMQKEIARS